MVYPHRIQCDHTMSTKLRVKSQDKHKRDSRYFLRHSHLDDCCRKQRDCRARRSRRTRQDAANLPDKNVISVIKSISGSSHCSTDSYFTSTAEYKLSRIDSQNSIIYVGTTYVKTEMPRKDSFIDLTKSDTTIISWGNNTNNLDNFDISGDNIIDEIHLKEQVSSAASIFTIYPPQPQNLFASPSDELCICQTDRSAYSSCNKRNLSTSDVSCHSSANKPKRVASSKSKIASGKVNTDDSTDCVWKLKRSYALTNGLCENNDANVMEGMPENAITDLASDVDILDIVDDLEKEFNIGQSQNSPLAEEINALKLASNIQK